MNLNEILTQHDPIKLALITLSNKELEKAFHEMLLKETGIDLTFQITTEYGIPTIMVIVPEWDTLPDEQRQALESSGYSFDYPDEDLNDLLFHLFKVEDIDVLKAGMSNESNFEISLYIPLVEYERLLTELAN